MLTFLYLDLSKARNELEKSKRKLDGDLRCSREAVAELERNKTELAQGLQVRLVRIFNCLPYGIAYRPRCGQDETRFEGKQLYEDDPITIDRKVVPGFESFSRLMENKMKF